MSELEKPSGSRVAASPVFALAILGGLLAGCAFRSDNNFESPPPLTPAPVGSVSSSDLPPLQPLPGQDGVQGQEQALVPGSPQDLQAIPDTRNTGVVASQDVRVSPTLAFDQQAVLGLWNVAANGDVCALSLNLTTWTGGFRASTRKCTEEVLTQIGAWQLSGQDLLLFDAKGSPLARLAVSGPNRFDGTAESINQQISVFR